MSSADQNRYDAILVVGFGGPEGAEDVIPFLENVLRGRPVPRERMLEVAEHYYHFGGVSPINGQVRDLIAALRPELDQHGIDIPLIWGNRNWQPMLADATRAMVDRKVGRALALVLSGYSSYSGCRQYREDIAKAQQEVGPDAPTVDKIRVFYNHPDWIAVNAERVAEALAQIPEARRATTHVVFTAHSIPESMANGCDYAKQLGETCRLVAEASGVAHWTLAYQSRSGRPTDPWLEPDILKHLADLKGQGVADVIVQPVGFLSDHMEVMFDLDEEAKTTAESLGMNLVRAGTAGTHPRFVAMLRELIAERLRPGTERRVVGLYPANHDVCPVHCCPSPARPGPPAGVAAAGARP